MSDSRTPLRARLIDRGVRGTTPYSLARRSREERVTVVLRKAGYDERTLVVSSATLVPARIRRPDHVDAITDPWN